MPDLKKLGYALTNSGTRAYTTIDGFLSIGKIIKRIRFEFFLCYRLHSWPDTWSTKFSTSQRIGAPVAPVILTNYNIITYGIKITI
jgi:hypothetical protein